MASNLLRLWAELTYFHVRGDRIALWPSCHHQLSQKWNREITHKRHFSLWWHGTATAAQAPCCQILLKGHVKWTISNGSLDWIWPAGHQLLTPAIEYLRSRVEQKPELNLHVDCLKNIQSQIKHNLCLPEIQLRMKPWRKQHRNPVLSVLTQELGEHLSRPSLRGEQSVPDRMLLWKLVLKYMRTFLRDWKI